jgi:four helix bundle protein
MTTSFLPQGGGYKNLRVYQITEVIYDLTYHFAHRFLRPGDRTVDQMIQAARSGKQNIAEGSVASTTSRETEIKLTNVAKASLEELLIDYQDYLRVNDLCIWDASHPRYQAIREYAKSNELRLQYTTLYEKLNGEEYCNLCITLINQATYMLKRLLDK